MRAMTSKYFVQYTGLGLAFTLSGLLLTSMVVNCCETPE